MLPQQSKVYAGFAVKALQEPHGDQIAQIAVARFVFAQQHKMPVFVIDAVNFIEPAALCNVDLAADDRLDAALFRCFIKVAPSPALYRAAFQCGKRRPKGCIRCAHANV